MRDKVFEEMIGEIAEELQLPEKEVELVIQSAYKSLRDDMAYVDFRAVKTQSDYDEVLKRTGLKYLGAFKLKKKNYITKNIL